jgi:hypothetical protein
MLHNSSPTGSLRQVLDLSSNRLTGPLQAGWASTLPALQRLNLSGNALSQVLPPSYAGFNHMEVRVGSCLLCYNAVLAELCAMLRCALAVA